MRFVVLFLALGLSKGLFSQTHTYTHADSIRGSITKERAWWNVLHYDLHVSFNYRDSSIRGFNKISYQVLELNSVLQVDLMEPMIMDSIVYEFQKCTWRKDGNAYFVNIPGAQAMYAHKNIITYFHGKPIAAKNPPWDGGLIWKKDKKGNPWISVACQGMAASVWFPCKDHQYDEVDSVSAYYTAPSNLVVVAAGKLRSKKLNADSTATYNWAVVNPINNYSIIPYIGKYVNFTDTFKGYGGVLKLIYWVLEGNLEKAKKQFGKEVKPMIRCFESWFGRYPFYEDGYKLVEAPHLGMEHQSAVAYGNDYQNGYHGMDLSKSGWGMKWDFIIVHESGHEWFGNNITTKDVADMWVHEGFTAYSENLYVEYLFGKKAGSEYVIGTRANIGNKAPIIGDYSVNNDGYAGTDMYYKGANMIHMIRQINNNDERWREMLMKMNFTFWHSTVTTNQIEDFMIKFLHLDLQKIFDQYLRTNQIPTLEYYMEKNACSFRWTNCIPGFNMPIKVSCGKNEVVLKPTEQWQTVTTPIFSQPDIKVDPNYYVNSLKTK
jgi:aminopeptidase N